MIKKKLKNLDSTGLEANKSLVFLLILILTS